MTTVASQSGHTLSVDVISQEEFGDMDMDCNPYDYTKFYTVRNFDMNGKIMFYMAKGYNKADKAAQKEVHVWYPKSKEMWNSFGNTFKEAIDGAQKDGWLYA